MHFSLFLSVSPWVCPESLQSSDEHKQLAYDDILLKFPPKHMSSFSINMHIISMPQESLDKEGMLAHISFRAQARRVDVFRECWVGTLMAGIT
jgi:hypothetical protein